MSKETLAEKKIRQNVFKFYAENKKLCDDSYEMAEDKNINHLYEFVENVSEKNILFTKVSIVIP